MPSLSEKDKANLLAIKDCANKILAFVKGINNAEEFYEDEKTFDAVLMNFIVIGETSVKLSANAKLLASEIPWTKIKDFRNLIAHDYFGVDHQDVWQIVHNELSDLMRSIEKISI